MSIRIGRRVGKKSYISVGKSGIYGSTRVGEYTVSTFRRFKNKPKSTDSEVYYSDTETEWPYLIGLAIFYPLLIGLWFYFSFTVGAIAATIMWLATVFGFCDRDDLVWKIFAPILALVIPYTWVYCGIIIITLLLL